MSLSCLNFLKRIVFFGFKKKVVVMFIIYVLYMLIGASLFLLLEWEDEEDQANEAVMNPDSNLINRMVDALRKQNISDKDISSSFDQEEKLRRPLSWLNVYGEKVFFSMVLITTVGYGNVAPKFTWGRCACIIYIFLGIPLNLILMRLLSMKFRLTLGRILRNFYSTSENQLPEKFQMSNVVVVLLTTAYFVTFSMLFIFGPAAAFYYLEQWTYSQCVYYSFVSLTTMGFGDYVAGKSPEGSFTYPLYISLMIFWLLFGVAYMLMSLNLISHLLGLLIHDKLDCTCYRRASAREDVNAIYENLLKLDLNLNSYTPAKFISQHIFEDFLSVCGENPQKITNDDLVALQEVVEDLKDKAVKEMELSQLGFDLEQKSGYNSETTDKYSESNESIKISSSVVSENTVTIIPQKVPFESGSEEIDHRKS